MTCIEARGLRKTYGNTVALDGIDLRVEEGRILGLIGPNGAGKTTALNAILGLTKCDGELRVLSRDPWTARDELVRDIAFIADVAVLPRWIRVTNLLDYAGGVHPRFDRGKAEAFLAKTSIKRTSRVRELSKGLVAQLHLAIVMAIEITPIRLFFVAATAASAIDSPTISGRSERSATPRSGSCASNQRRWYSSAGPEPKT